MCAGETSGIAFGKTGSGSWGMVDQGRLAMYGRENLVGQAS